MRIKEEKKLSQTIKKSEFIACISPVKTEEQASAYISRIKKEYSDANHVCTAYIIGANGQIQHSSDNKEPAGTAGVPMLEVLKRNRLSDVCVCVVRYFGGIKLGAGGLLRAYSSSVSNVLGECEIVTDAEYKQYSITYPYELSKVLEQWLRRNTDIVDFLYDENVTCLFETESSSIETDISDLTHGKCIPVFIKTVLKEKPVIVSD